MQETMRIKREYSEALKDDREDKVECLGTSNAKRAKGAEAADMVHDE